jgi:uncharacterized protein (DUF3084 family)
MNSGEPVTLPAPAIDQLTPALSKWEREYQAFRRLLPQLLQTHRGQYVAIHEGQVVASGKDKLQVALQVFSRIGNVSIHVGLVTEGTEPVLRSGVRRVLPSPEGGA